MHSGTQPLLAHSPDLIRSLPFVHTFNPLIHPLIPSRNLAIINPFLDAWVGWRLRTKQTCVKVGRANKSRPIDVTRANRHQNCDLDLMPSTLHVCISEFFLLPSTPDGQNAPVPSRTSRQPACSLMYVHVDIPPSHVPYAHCPLELQAPNAILLLFPASSRGLWPAMSTSPEGSRFKPDRTSSHARVFVLVLVFVSCVLGYGLGVGST